MSKTSGSQSRAQAVKRPSKAKDRQYFAELLLKLEDRLDVNRYKAEGIHLWPLMRWELARGIKQVQFDDEFSDTVDTVRSLGFTGGREERVEVMRRAREVEREQYPEAEHQRQEQIARLKALGPCDFAVFAKVEMYYQKIGDKFYAPIIDPVYENLARRGPAHVIGLEPIDIACVNEPCRLSIDPYMRLTSKMRLEPPPPGMEEQVREINAVLEEIAPDFSLDFEHLAGRFNRYRRRVWFFRDVLETLMPRAVFCSSFVGWAPLIWAAREAGIPAVDIQHGGQSPYHYHTTQWTKLPPEGYELMPDFFWVWGEAIRSYITPWLPGAANRHIAVVGGHRYVAKWKSAGAEASIDDPRAAALFERMDKAEKVILVTLGYSVEEIVPKGLYDAIKSTPDWLWLLRLHPINRGQRALDEMKTKFVDAKIENVEYESSTLLPLHPIMARVDCHVTPFSTTGREAMVFTVPTLVIHPIGGTYFKDEIAAGTFGYAEDGDDIVAWVNDEANGAGASGPAGEPFIEVDDARAEAAIDLILAASRRQQPLARSIRRIWRRLRAAVGWSSGR